MPKGWILDIATCSCQAGSISLHHVLEVIGRDDMMLHFGMLEVIPKRLKYRLVIAGPCIVS
jgi:hypothetical protein